MLNKLKGETILIAHNEMTSSEVINRLYEIIYDDNNNDWDLNYIVWTTCMEICDLPIPLKPLSKTVTPDTPYKSKVKKSFISKINRYRKIIRCNRKGVGLRIHSNK